MTTRLVRVCVCVLAGSMFLPDASAAVPEPPQQETAAAEPSGPKASPTVEKMLSEAGRQADAKQPLDSLKAADQALEAARQVNDTAGEALAQQARAKALQNLKRPDEALTAWQEAQQLWARMGDTPEQITALVQEGLLSVNKKGEAERLFSQGLAVAQEETQRPDALAQSLHDSAGAMVGQGNWDSQWDPASDYLRAEVAIREKQTPQSIKLAAALNNLSRLAHRHWLGEYAPQDLVMAHDYAARAVEVCQRLAPDSAPMVASLRNLGEAEQMNNDPRQADSAREHFLTALRIQKKLIPGGSDMEADLLTNLGIMEMNLSNLTLAHHYLDEAVPMAEKLDPTSFQFSRSLSWLEILESEEGDLPAARAHCERMLSMAEKSGGPGAIANASINLGDVLTSQGDFALARTYLEKALAIFQRISPNGMGGPMALSNIATTFYRQGDLASSLEYRQRVVAILEQKDKGAATMGTAKQLSGLGDIFLAQGKFSLAADNYHRALEMREKANPESFEVSDSLAALAGLERARKNTSLALDYDLRALKRGQKSCPNSWCVAGILNDLGELAYEQGDLASSESYLRQAVDLREKSLGPAHPDLARSLNDLALTVAALGKTPEALEMSLRAERIGAEHLRVSVRTLSERQALAYEGIRASGLDVALTLVGGANAPAARSEVFDAVIHSRALVFDELAARHRSAYGSGDPEVKQLADQLSSSRAQLATLVFRGAEPGKADAYRKVLDNARDRKEKAERALAEKSIAFRQDQARARIGLKEIAASLPEGAALVAFVRYARRDPQRSGASKGAPEPVPSYAALVLRAGKHDPEFFRLGTAREIESLVAAWRSDIARQAEATNVSAQTAEDAYRHAGAALRRRIWDPLLPSLGDAREVFVVPDGALHLVSLPSLPVGSSEYLVETKPLIHYLSTERDLVPEQAHHGEGILVVGNPAFDQAGRLAVASNQQSAPPRVSSDTTATLLRGTRSACGTFQTLHFAALPASQREAENIAALWMQSRAGGGAEIMRGSAAQAGIGESTQMTGADASPEAFTQYAPGKRVLHVATHGFFLEGSCESALQRRLDPSKRDESVLPATAENPLLLSGLAFAGANRRSSAKADETDGILTAEEIAGINLEGVDWAVLSACDTGVGEIKVGEGVFGLRRAFQVAGAKTVIMSLWPVEDKTTEQWMGTLYREHFLNGKDTTESVRAASVQILRQRRAKHQSTHPFYWGAFIAAGDWH
ncbi:MAG TPA: CHAT domain-containing tetratricopeptide repeat protein [Candidatus Dormibacteraeota bacterium]|nr:CHAT domain-containing tetratricopeptide repeat protein [Candidatus Dormibacteraeota bacterium]